MQSHARIRTVPFSSAVVAALAALAALFWIAPHAQAAPKPPPTFVVVPSRLVFQDTPVGQISFAEVTLTNNGPTTAHIIGGNPGEGIFGPTWAGSCNNTYNYYLPAGTSCTIQWGFKPDSAGNHSATGAILFEGGAQATFSLRGRGVRASVDLAISNVVLHGADVSYPFTYTVTVQNLGTSSVNGSLVAIQGYYSADATVQHTDNPACGWSGSGTLAGNGGTIDIFVGCSFTPAAGENNLLVQVDPSNQMAEANEANNVYVKPLS